MTTVFGIALCFYKYRMEQLKAPRDVLNYTPRYRYRAYRLPNRGRELTFS